MEEEPVRLEIALIFLRACGFDPVHHILRRRGKLYDLWGERKTHQKIISTAQLQKMTMKQLVVWLKQRSYMANVLFPDANIYHQREQLTIRDWRQTR